MKFVLLSVVAASLVAGVSAQVCPPNPPLPKGPHSLDCNFDNDDICFWEHVSGLQMTWLLQSGSTPSFATGPSNDHTTGTSTGKYLFIETSSPNLAGFKAQIRTRDVLDPSCSSCNLTFWYHMYGATIKDLRVFLEPTNGMAAKVVWSETGDQGNQWNFATVPLQSSVSYRIIFEGERGSSYNGDIAIDDIKFEYCPKPPTPTPPPPCSPKLGPGDCDFEQDSCRCCCWRNTFQGDYNDWHRTRGTTQSHITGPQSDHTYGNNSGHYMYIEVSKSKRGWQSLAKLESRKLKGIDKANRCMLTVWYHMSGRDIGKLQIKKLLDGQSWWYNQPVLFTRSGHQSDTWLNVTVDLYTSNDENTESVVSIEADNIYGPFGDMAVDDITFSPGCTSYFADTDDCDNSAVCTAINATDWCDPSYSSGKVVGDCDFECGVCYWNDSTCADAAWVMNEGGTESWGTGPGIDHTYGTTNEGHYMYFEAGGWWSAGSRKKGYNSILESPNVVGSSQPCTMTLWYHMLGQNIGKLKVYMKSTDVFQKMMEVSGPQGDKWIQANVTFLSRTDYRIHIVATYKDGYQGDIAIDDISFRGPGCAFNKKQGNSYCNNALKSGCADKSREGFFNEPNVAGCQGEWDGLKSLRDVPTGKCGNKFPDGRTVKCREPADLCDVDNGWRICGSNGNPADIRNYIGGKACSQAAYGRFSAGINHCRRGGCDTASPKDYGCTHFDTQCNEPLCCGLECDKDTKCPSSFFPQSTYYSPVTEFKGCSRLSADDAGGVMCCYCPDCPTKPPLEQFCDCSFDDGDCNFVDETDDNYDWQRNSGGTPSWSTGPDNDHTTDSNLGYYMYAAAGHSLSEGSVAILRSPEYKVSDLKCGYCRLEFWYHMKGSNVGSLEVFIEGTYSSQAQVRRAAWKKSGDQGGEWKQAVIAPLDIKHSTFHILFLATRGNGYQGDIAIDDISFGECDYTTSPPATTPPPKCGDGEYQCVADYRCIPWDKLCDERPDCSDGSDEINEKYNPCDVTFCDPYYCVNDGRCFIDTGENKCLCPHPYYGKRCEKTYFAPKPTVKLPPTEKKTPRPPACDPDAENSKCSCQDDSLMRESGYCVICVQTEENGDVCVCDSQGYCYPTIEFVRNKDVEVFGTAAVQPGNQEQGGSSGGSSSDDSKYIAIGITIAVVGLVIITIVVFFIMRQKYQTKETVHTMRRGGDSDSAFGNVGYTANDGGKVDLPFADSGVGNPLYNQPYANL